MYISLSEAEIAYRERRKREDNLINTLAEIQWKTIDKKIQRSKAHLCDVYLSTATEREGNE
jgi:hypothetical protein